MKAKFKKGIMLAIFAVIAIAAFDLLAAKSGLFGTIEDYTLGNYLHGWWDLFFKFNVILLLSIPIAYYFFARRDKSEAIALFLTSYILWFMGLADAFYFFLQGKMIPQVLPWLNGNIIIGNLAKLLGQETVTRTVLLVSIGLGFLIIYKLDKYLEGIN